MRQRPARRRNPTGSGEDHRLAPLLASAGVITNTRADPVAKSSPSGDLAVRRPWPGQVASLLSYHWLAAVLVVAGAALRVITWMAYHPAIFYIDSAKYLYQGWQDSDPLGYKIALKLVLSFGDLGAVTALQHLLGLGMGIALYALLVRRGVSRWLSALAMAPILLDAYQLQAEATIMPDVLFEGMIVAGICLLLWRPTANWPTIVGTGLILGLSATVRELGLWLIGPAVLYLLGSRFLRLSRDDWSGAVVKSCVLVAVFLVPVLAYCSVSDVVHGYFGLSIKTSPAGRLAQSADCATLKVRPAVKQLCPPASIQDENPDWVQNWVVSVLRDHHISGAQRKRLISDFDHAVERQQPLRVAAAVLRDAARLFEVSRTGTLATTPISRWQFKQYFPQYRNNFMVCGGMFTTDIPPQACDRPDSAGDIIVGVQRRHYKQDYYFLLSPSYGGKAQVDQPLAAFLQSYQVDGGFTPGPLFLVFALAGLFGSLLALIFRRGNAIGRNMALASLVFFTAALGLLLVGDLYVFSWRYQLQALITLPPAGVLGAAAAWQLLRRGRNPAAPAQLESKPEAPS